ncbi:MAG TPA: efflux RND transporter periplasmic adaptor subunit [Candidatus Polarisedimenticolaceae bacterium]|nr:efflux RND transporter periplasmic adaptor subunit [Candidatus Polarisedimenticolaceae bacterium]
MSVRVVRTLSWLAAVVAVGLVVGFFVLRNGRADEPRYRTESAQRGDVTMVVTATGTISAVTTVLVGSQVSGIIAKLHADFNSRVKSGQLLAELDPTPFEQQVAQRRADLVQAQVQARNAGVSFHRQERLRAEGLAAEADYDAAKAAYDSATAQVDQAQASLSQTLTNLRYTKILSPIEGVVVDRQYDVGQTVAASFQAPTLFTIAQDLTKMQVQADVDQADIGRISVGQPANFTVDAYPEQTFRGRISQVRLNATVNQNVITYPVILEVDNPQEKLRPKMTADVTIEVDKVKDVLRVPNASLRFRPLEGPEAASQRRGPEASQGGGGERGGAGRALRQFDQATGGGGRTRPNRQTVYVLRGGERVEPVEIRTGISDGRYTAVVEGELQPGDMVIVGLVTTRVETTGRPPGMGSPGGGGRGPRGF